MPPSLREIAVTVSYWENQLELAEAAYEKRKEQIAEKIAAAQAECQHPKWRRIPDASGGNDTEDVCDLYGKRE